MTDDRIKAVYEEYGRIVTGKEYALIHAIAEAVSPQRTWVGLTPEEIVGAWKPHMKHGTIEFAYAIEAKLKEKNNTP